MDISQIRTRIAPSPTGDAHIGLIYQAIIDYTIAKKYNGKFIVRIEDTDRTRYVPGSIEKIFKYLSWAGLVSDENPEKGGSFGPYIQSLRLDLYKKYALELIEKNKAYYCFCSSERLDTLRLEQQKEKMQPKYDRICRLINPAIAKERIDKGERCVIRMKIPDNEIISFIDQTRGEISFESNQIDDQVILKSDGFPTYHLAVVVDDHLMQISHVVRGEEWISSTPKHILLYRYFGWNPTLFIHTQVIRNADKSKLSKRKGDVSVGSFINKGYLPEAIVNFLSLLICPNAQNKDIFDMTYFIENFSFAKMSKTGPIFDIAKLDWINGTYIRSLELVELKNRIEPFLTLNTTSHTDKYLLQSLSLIQERMKRLDEADELLELFYVRPKIDLIMHTNILKQLYTLTEMSLENGSELETQIRIAAEKDGKKAGEYFTLLRDAVTGKKATPPLIPLMKVLGLEESLMRIKQSIGE